MAPSVKELQAQLDQERADHAATKNRMQGEIDQAKAGGGRGDETKELEEKLKKQAGELKKAQDEAESEKKAKKKLESAKEGLEEKLQNVEKDFKESKSELGQVKADLAKVQKRVDDAEEKRKEAEEKFEKQKSDMNGQIDILLRTAKARNEKIQSGQINAPSPAQQSSPRSPGGIIWNSQTQSPIGMQRQGTGLLPQTGTPNNSMASAIFASATVKAAVGNGDDNDEIAGMNGIKGGNHAGTNSFGIKKLDSKGTADVNGVKSPDGSPNSNNISSPNSSRRKPSILKTMSAHLKPDNRSIEDKFIDLQETTMAMVETLESRLDTELQNHNITKGFLKINLEKLYQIEQKPIDLMYQQGALTARPRLQSEFKELEFQKSMKKRTEMMDDYQTQFSIKFPYLDKKEYKGAPYISPGEVSPFRKQALADYELQRQLILGKKARDAGLMTDCMQKPPRDGGVRQPLTKHLTNSALSTGSAAWEEGTTGEAMKSNEMAVPQRRNSKTLAEAACGDPEKADGTRSNTLNGLRRSNMAEAGRKGGSVVIQDTIDLVVENEDDENQVETRGEKVPEISSAKNGYDAKTDDAKADDGNKGDDQKQTVDANQDGGHGDQDAGDEKKEKMKKKKQGGTDDDDGTTKERKKKKTQDELGAVELDGKKDKKDSDDGGEKKKKDKKKKE